MMSGNESSDEDENPKPITYINVVIQHINKEIEQADTLIAKENYIEAEEVLANAINHYEVRIHDLSQFQQKMYFPDMSNLDGSKNTRARYDNVSIELVSRLKVLVKNRETNLPKAEAQKEYKKLKEQKALAIQKVQGIAENFEKERQALEELTKKTDEAHAIYIEESGDEKTPDESSEPFTNMQILGAFITALGAAAVAIAFVVLSAAGLAMPGVVLTGFGVGTALLGASIFNSKAKNIDEYKDNICAYFSPSTEIYV
jgi:hypothetical protein